MTKRIACIQPEQKTSEGLAIMTEKCVRHLLVIENGELIG